MVKSLLVPMFALLAASATTAQAKPMKWMDGTAVGLPKGSEVAVVKGDPAKAGDFIVRLKVPAGCTTAPATRSTWPIQAASRKATTSP